jgi:nucleoside-triphosphatase THEP1
MRLVAVLYEGEESKALDQLLSETARALREDGFSLSGAVQSNVAVPNRSRCDIALEDLATGRVTMASQDRGASARGCRLDSGALEESVGLAASSLNETTDLVIINRFGRQEAEGHGFRSMIEQAVVLNIPVLVGLKRANLDSWHAFLGEVPEFLPLHIGAVMDWCASKVGVCAS